MTPILLASGAFLIALMCAVLMGYAIQRGATCMVAAIDEVVSKRKATQFVALIEASLWVAAGLLLAHLAGVLSMQPTGFATTGWTVAGGLMLGWGALINRACVFGSIARLGSGEWAYVLTPVGFFIGCLTARPLVAAAMPVPLPQVSPLFGVTGWLLVPLGAFAAWRGLGLLCASVTGGLAAHVWSPHRATTVIGLTFVTMLLTVGAWAYTDALAQLAQGMAENTIARLALFAGLLFGAVFGGLTAGRLRQVRPNARSMVRCMAGGMMMGWGSMLIPGSNDGLILVGLPLLQPHAWVALAFMAFAIASGLLIDRCTGRASYPKAITLE